MRSASSAPGALFEAARQAMVALGPSTPVVLVDDADTLVVNVAAPVAEDLGGEEAPADEAEAPAEK